LENKEKINLLFEKAPMDGATAECGRMSQKQLTNLINFLNFQDEGLTVNFRHRRFGNILSIEARPLPCLTPVLECRWVVPRPVGDNLQSYELHNVVLPDGLKQVIIDGGLLSITDEGMSISLPETVPVTTLRAVRRHQCNDIECELIQNGIVFKGRLLDFNPVSFNIEASASPSQSFLWLSQGLPVLLILRSAGEIVYSGECSTVRHSLGMKIRRFILKPLRKQVRRFKLKNVRSRRYNLSPSPHIWFRHPLTNKTIHLVVDELSGSGFSVEELFDSSVLLAGLIIPELALEITNNVTVICRAQVINNIVDQISDDKATQKCGIAFLNMDIQGQTKLANLLYQQHDRRASVCARVDMDDLWRFFFETGFIYPQKYTSISSQKGTFRETYEKLYLEHPEIARHFIYLDKGHIHAHISMIHLHENTWLFHHHAADKLAGRRAGMGVLYDIGQYVNDFYNLPSTHLHYVISYFRADNRFPQKIFGGAKDAINNPKGCSIDPFLFMHHHNSSTTCDEADSIFSGSGSTLEKTNYDDLVELGFYYERYWGGLTLTALDLTPESSCGDELSVKYKEAKLERKRFVYSLKRDGLLVAVFLLTVTDFGLNLSNLTSCIHVFILDPAGLSSDLFYASLNRLSGHFSSDDIPVLILGSEYAEVQAIPYEKVYNCWVINLPEAIDQYYLFVNTFLLRGQQG
jgi:hypothetical protein